jgi:hypothetical protein
MENGTVTQRMEEESYNWEKARNGAVRIVIGAFGTEK